MQYHRGRLRRGDECDWRQGGEVEPNSAGRRIPGMGVSGGPTGAEGIGQIRVVVMLGLRLSRDAEARRVGQPGNTEREEDLTKQRGDPEPGRDPAPDSTTHRRLASPPGGVRAGQVRRYFTSSVAHASPGKGRLAQASRLPGLAGTINR